MLICIKKIIQRYVKDTAAQSGVFHRDGNDLSCINLVTTNPDSGLVVWFKGADNVFKLIK